MQDNANVISYLRPTFVRDVMEPTAQLSVVFTRQWWFSTNWKWSDFNKYDDSGQL